MLGGSEDSPGLGVLQTYPGSVSQRTFTKGTLLVPTPRVRPRQVLWKFPRWFWGTSCLRNKSSTPTSSEAVEALWGWGGVGGSGQEQMVISSSPWPNNPHSAREMGAEVSSLALPLASCVTLGKLLDVSVVNFLS